MDQNANVSPAIKELFDMYAKNNMIKHSVVKNLLVSMGADYGKILYEAQELQNIELLNIKQFE